VAWQKKRDAHGAEILSNLDKLYVVHVWKDGKKEKDREKDKWCAGGPLLPGLGVALAKFPHTVVELEVREPEHKPAPGMSGIHVAALQCAACYSCRSGIFH
jgi:hypothetical protein